MKLPCLFRTGHLGCGSYGGRARGAALLRSVWQHSHRHSHHPSAVVQIHRPSGWYEWGQICGPCLNIQWRSMTHSWDANIHDDSDCSHTQWKKGLFMKVIRRSLRPPPTAGIEEEVRDPEHYELRRPVAPDESDDGR